MKISWVLTHFVYLMLLFLLCSLGAAEDISTIDVLKADELIRSDNYGYLDVRTEKEFKKGHVDVENPLNIADGRVKNPDFLEQVLALCNKDAHLVVECQSRASSVYATIDLQNIWFKNLYNMGGGYLAWVENGLPVTKPEAKIDLTVNLTKLEAENILHLTLNEVNSENGVKDIVGKDLNVIANESVVQNDLTGTVNEAKVNNGLAVTVTEQKVEL